MSFVVVKDPWTEMFLALKLGQARDLAAWGTYGCGIMMFKSDGFRMF